MDFFSSSFVYAITQVPYMSILPYGSEVRLSTSMTEENCSYFKNMHKTHLLDENNILPSCEIELP